MLLTDATLLVRQRADLIGDPNISDTEIQGLLNVALAEVYGLLIDSFEDYSVTTAQFTLGQSDTGFALPSDFFKELRVDRSYSSVPTANDWFRLDRINIRDESNFNQVALRSLSNRRVYGWCMYGSTIRIVPQSLIAGVYQLLYYPAWVDLNPGDTVAIGPPGQHWEELAVVKAAIACLDKQEADSGALVRREAALTERMRAEAANRSAGEAEPPALSDVPWYERASYGAFGIGFR